MNIYGIISDGAHIDVSKTERGAKLYATKHGYNQISIRYNLGYNAERIAQKINGRWISQRIIDRLEYLRGEILQERISYAEIAELRSLARYIDKSDVELRQAAGLPEKLNF